jgi:hypothetical protein
MFALSTDAEAEFAALMDYMRDFRDCADLYSESQKLDVYADLQDHIDALAQQQVALSYSVRKVALRWNHAVAAEESSRASILYVLAYPAGKEPKEVAVPRKAKIGF